MDLIIKSDRIGIAVGWRIYPSDGGHHDLMWGNTKNDESLTHLVHDMRTRKCFNKVIDERYIDKR